MPQQSAPFASFCIVADDLSGAADCAASFAPVAGPVPVWFGGGFEPSACFAVDTDSRTMDEGAATATTRAVFTHLAASPGRLVYKKIDSTLRGHVGAELAAALDAAPGFAGAVVAPAFPQQGRALAGGRLVVHGRASEPPVDLAALLRAAGLRTALIAPEPVEPGVLAQRIERSLRDGARAVVVDAGTQEELARLAAAIAVAHAPLLVAGSAGLARELAVHVGRGASGEAAPEAAPAGGVLAVVGSFSAASAAQVRELEASREACVLRLSALQWQDDDHIDLRRLLADEATHALATGRHVVLAIADSPAQPFSRSVVRALAAVAAPLLAQASACVLTGGDTARAVFDALAIARLDVAGEFEPGVSIARAPAHPGRLFLLKAGGFGDALTLQRAIRRFGRT